MKDDVILVTQKDYIRIQNLLAERGGEDYEDLEIELDRAGIVLDNEVPDGLVTMNSRVRFRIMPDDREMVVTLVYPSEASSKDGKISILAPMGSAILGLRTGQSINWKFPDGKTRTLNILEVLYQPEACGDYHL